MYAALLAFVAPCSPYSSTRFMMNRSSKLVTPKTSWMRARTWADGLRFPPISWDMYPDESPHRLASWFWEMSRWSSNRHTDAGFSKTRDDGRLRCISCAPALLSRRTGATARPGAGLTRQDRDADLQEVVHPSAVVIRCFGIEPIRCLASVVPVGIAPMMSAGVSAAFVRGHGVAGCPYPVRGRRGMLDRSITRETTAWVVSPCGASRCRSRV